MERQNTSRRAHISLLAVGSALLVCLGCAESNPPPDAPADLTAVVGRDRVSFSWQPSAAATGYRLLRGTKKEGPFATVVAETAHTVAEDLVLPAAGKPQFYVAVAVSPAGQSADSNVVKIALLDAPIGLKAEGKPSRVELSWEASVGATSYEVLRSDVSGMDYVLLGSIEWTSFIDYSADGTERYYVVRAIGEDCKSGDSAEVAARALSGREVVVADAERLTVSVFDAAQQGAGTPLRQLGWVTGLDGATALAIDSGGGEVFVATFQPGEEPRSSVLVFAKDASGAAAPVRAIVGSDTGLSDPAALVVDGANKQLLVANRGSNSVAVYPIAASRNAQPVSALEGSLTGLAKPRGLALDGAHKELFVLNEESVTVYERAAAGDHAPLRSLAGPNTGLKNPRAIAVDEVEGRLWVAVQEPDALLVFARDAKGDVAPIRTISGRRTLLRSPSGLVLDRANGEVIVSNAGDLAVVVHGLSANGDNPPIRTLAKASSGSTGSHGVAKSPTEELVVLDGDARALFVYPRQASGDAAPDRTVSGGVCGFAKPRGIVTDSKAGEIYVVDEGKDGPGAVVVFARSFSAGAAPVRTFSSPTLLSPWAVAVVHGEESGEVFVADPVANLVAVFPLEQSGSISATRQISAASTQLDEPVAIAVDAASGEIFIVNRRAGTVTVYAPTADGDVSPVRTISGAKTLLSGPSGIAIHKDEIFVSNAAGKSLVVFPKDADGDVDPKAFLSLTDDPGAAAVAVDPESSEVFVASGSQILVYDSSKIGAADALVRSFSAPELRGPGGIAFW